MTPIDESFDAPTKTIVSYFVAMWEERLQFWDDYLAGKLPPDSQARAHKSRQGRLINGLAVDEHTSALHERGRVKLLVDGWRRRMEGE